MNSRLATSFVIALFFAWGESCIYARQNHAGREQLPSEWQEDACLNDVVFHNHDLGWSVGDRGVILRTENGGRTWQPIHSGVSCNLQSICFVDDANGWAVGGFVTPMISQSNGVILKSTNGGRTWEVMNTARLPALNKVTFQNQQTGWAVGLGSPTHPGGIFHTRDGGKSWVCATINQKKSWIDGASSAEGVISVEEGGTIEMSNGMDARKSSIRGIAESRHILGVHMDADREEAWSISHSNLFSSKDDGRSWQVAYPSKDNPAMNSLNCDWQSVYAKQGTVWLAGNPGTYVYRLDQTSGEWSANRTGINQSINKMFFVDGERGWAVGDLGTIISTRDGGKTWRNQRVSVNRAALLVVADYPDSISPELIAKLCGEGNYVGAITFVGENGSSAFEKVAAKHAFGRLGNSIINWFPRHQPLPQRQDSLNGYLVRQIRTLKPTTIVVAAGEYDNNLSANVLSAVQLAADRNSHSTQITVAALQPWQTQKVFVENRNAKNSDINMSTFQYLPSLGRNLDDISLISYGILSRFPSAAKTLNLRSLYSTAGRGSTRNRIFGTISNPAFRPVKRSRKLNSRSTREQMNIVSKKRKWLGKMVREFDYSPKSHQIWVKQIRKTTSSIPADIAGSWLWQLAERYWNRNQSELAAKTLVYLINRFPNDSLADASRLWLLTYYSSAEYAMAEHRIQSLQSIMSSSDTESPTKSKTAAFRSVPEQVTIGGKQRLIWVAQDRAQKEGDDPRGRVAINDGVVSLSELIRIRFHAARKIKQQIETQNPNLLEHPSIKLALCDLIRNADGPAAGMLSYNPLSRGDLRSTIIGRIARTEADMADVQQQNRDWSDYTTSRIEDKPYLDGVLDETCWQTSLNSPKLISLQTTSMDDRPNTKTVSVKKGDLSTNHAVIKRNRDTKVILVHDNEFLYVAAHCLKSEAFDYRETIAKRERDADLKTNDRLEILVDADRDRATCYCLTVDFRGWVAESLDGNRDWNPAWYVAQHSNEESWTIEAAIPLRELTNDVSRTPLIWNIAMTRRIPDQEPRTWAKSAPAISTQHADWFRFSTSSKAGLGCYKLIKFQ